VCLVIVTAACPSLPPIYILETFHSRDDEPKGQAGKLTWLDHSLAGLGRRAEARRAVSWAQYPGFGKYESFNTRMCPTSY